MIKHGNRIRLTGREATLFKIMTGSTHPPQTVAEHNRKLKNAKALFAPVADECPEAKLLVGLCDDKIIK